MHRRTFLQQIATALAVAPVTSCRRTPQRESVLRAIVTDIVVPNTAALAEESRRLDAAVSRFVADPGGSTLRSAREQWTKALLGWKRAYAFRNGPVVETSAFLRAAFWPARIQAIEGLLREARQLDAAAIEGLGVDLKGLFALEHLLFSSGASDEETILTFAGSPGEQRRRFAGALASNVSLYADRAARLLGDGKAYAAIFAQGGRDSLNRLVGQMADTIENVAAARLARIAGFARSGLLKPSEVEGSASQTSREISVVYMTATEKLYVGGDPGLGDLVRAVSRPIDERVRSSFVRAIDAVKKLSLPLEQVAKSDLAALDAAAASVKSLEVSMKSDLSSALGVTLTFTAGDGD